MGIRVTLGGVPIALERGTTFAWSLAYGVAPTVQTLTTTQAIADEILALAENTFDPVRLSTTSLDPAGPLTLVMEDTDAGRRVEIKGLYAVVGNRPGLDYNSRSITLADRRWLWEYTFVEGSYNIRRSTGSHRLVGSSFAPFQLLRNTPDKAYRPQTLNPVTRKPWTPAEILTRVLTELCGPGGFVIDVDIPPGNAVENMLLHDTGPQALSRVLAYIPGIRVYAGTDGLIHVGNIYDESEGQAFLNAGNPISGDWNLTDKSQMRPPAFTVYFDREVELRFDAVEVRDTGSSVPPEDPQRPARTLRNVILNPLYQLAIPASGNSTARIATQNDPIPLSDFIAAANLSQNFSGFVGKLPDYQLTEADIRRHWLGNWQYLVLSYATRVDGVVNPERAKMLSAIRNYYRQLFQIERRWIDQIRGLKAVRAAVVDYENGTRSPAAVYTQYITKASQLAWVPLAGPTLSTNTDDYAADISINSISPFSVEVKNPDVGLILLRPSLDQTGLAETYVLGEAEDFPSANLNKRAAATFWNLVGMTENFKVAVILSAIQDGPNDIRRLHSAEITIFEAADILGVDPGEVKGPPMDLFQSSDTARFGWLDSQSSAIEEAFFTGAQVPGELLSNRDEIESLSLSTAASALSTMLDRVEGRATYSLLDVEPTGNLRTVTHLVSVGAQNSTILTTTLQAPGEAAAPDPFALMAEGPRAKIRRLVQQ